MLDLELKEVVLKVRQLCLCRYVCLTEIQLVKKREVSIASRMARSGSEAYVAFGQFLALSVFPNVVTFRAVIQVYADRRKRILIASVVSV
jgi:hypothetical protein